MARPTVTGPCKLCAKPAYVVDHCHTSGMIRGFLCRKCNRALITIWEDQKWRKKAIRYLSQDLGISYVTANEGRVGRPGRPRQFDRTYYLKLKRLDRKRWERKAAQAEKELSEWIRDTLNAAAQK